MWNPRMKPLCSFCGVQQALVYCKSDAARLCLICDAYVHAANALSHRHMRAQICDRCHAQPAASRCPDDYIALCDICDLSGDSPSDAPQRRVPIGFYSGCPTPDELLAIWFDADESCATWEVPLEADLGVVSQPIKLEPVWTPSSASHLSSDSASPLSCDEDQIPIVPTGSELPNASSLTHDFVAPLQPCIDATSSIVQGVNINADQLLMNLNGNRNINLAFPPVNVCPNMSLSFSSLTGESNGYGYQDCGVSPLFFATETSWDSNQEKSSRKLRYEAKIRYKEKKKIRLFGKQVRYAARKASADNRKRVKGRFVRAAGKFDHVPFAESQ